MSTTLRGVTDDLTGRRLGHYRVDGVIGKGGMAVLYRATDVRLGRKVALKVIAGHLSEDAEFRERFADEARNTSAIDHAHVVPLYDFGEIDGLLYIAMRFVDGADLASLISEGPISPARTLMLLGQVADALEMLHGQQLVHLDVKPANVLVTTRESAGVEHVYLGDFGLTRYGATGHRTASGDFLGSPTYAAPEHLRGEPVDPRTDQYGLACVMYACLTGTAPFRGTVPDVVAAHLGTPVPAVTSVVELPEAIDGVIARGMAKYPRSRYPNCRELLSAARSALRTVSRPGDPPVLRRVKPTPEATPPAAPPPEPPPQPSAPAPAVPPATPAALPSKPAAPPAPASAGPLRPPATPVRLRDPMPAQPANFATRRGDWGQRWAVPVALAVVVLVIVGVLMLLLG